MREAFFASFGNTVRYGPSAPRPYRYRHLRQRDSRVSRTQVTMRTRQAGPPGCRSSILTLERSATLRTELYATYTRCPGACLRSSSAPSSAANMGIDPPICPTSQACILRRMRLIPGPGIIWYAIRAPREGARPYIATLHVGKFLMLIVEIQEGLAAQHTEYIRGRPDAGGIPILIGERIWPGH
jgi:hypothetical protein